MRKLWISILAGALAAVLPIALHAQTQEKAESQTLFKQHCAMCHGADGRGQTPMGKRLNLKDLHSPEIQKQTDAELTTTIRDGKGKMPPFKSKLKPEEIHDLVTYIHSLGK